ncbi:hypothetical protein VKT23_012351 [Stygiomarasmius scandens]|uniref:C3H1-type domain-containing protein n=1 Tax=Marasmiellus scandens TaxID=2682957 RepID=A0ABR1J6K6_9AGAR
MPAVDRGDSSVEREKEREEKGGDKGKTKSGAGASSASSSSKAKDLSHVPCKFFKVGSCTAGSSCPFSHAVSEPGAAKDVCAWFVKGNCKFGHKCALAHILPGQSMAWDRKNKKAAQAAAGGGKDGKGAKSSKRDTQSRPPITMSLKATPSAPAPALKDTDFASFSALDVESQKLPSAPAQGRQSQDSPSDSKPTTADTELPAKPPSPGIPLSSPRKNPSSPKSSNPPIDYGPIGSPPRSASSTSHPHPISRLNGTTGGFSPGTSPRNGSGSISGTPTNNHLSTSPFNPPGAQNIFNPEPGRQGVAASLSGLGILGGRGRPNWGSVGSSSDIGSLPNLSQSHGVEQIANKDGMRTQGKNVDIGFEYEEYLGSGIAGSAAARRAAAIAAGTVNLNSTDDDLEDFIPGSLTDLLTPEERSRRMSRSNSGQDANGGLTSPTRRAALGVPLREAGTPSSPGGGNGGNGHRYSRSVPAPSLLGDVSSIWAPKEDLNAAGLPSSPSARGLGNGTPSSFTSASNGAFGGRAGAFDPLGDELLGAGGEWPAGMSLSPSNASAAFLPSLHYLKAKHAQGLGRGVRGVSSPLIGQQGGNQLSGVGGGNSSQIGTPRTSTNGFEHYNALSSNANHANNGNNNGTINNNADDPAAHHTRPIPHHLPHSEDPHVLSPSTRALQAHAPGQSLPQGLAAGYSRIHAMPALSSSAASSTTGGIGAASPGSVGWMGTSIGGTGQTNAFTTGPFGAAKDDWGNTSVPPGLGLGLGGYGSGGLNPNAQVYAGQGQYNTFSALNAVNGQQQQPQQQLQQQGQGQTQTELDSLSKISYSAAASKGAPSGAVLTPQKMQGSTSSSSSGSGSGAKLGGPGAASSPLSGAVVSSNDDDGVLFEMDG